MRGEEATRPVHAFIVGLGLGVWQYNSQQPKPYSDDPLIVPINRIALWYVQVVELSWVKDSH
jgi:hypothetical protein